MKKAGIYTILAMVIFSFGCGSSYSQEKVPRADNSAFENPRRVPSIFKHDEHDEEAGIEECNVCHHVYKNGKKVEGETSEEQLCSECHKEKSSGDMPSLRKAYHIQCKGCHIKQRFGPVMCGECHVK